MERLEEGENKGFLGYSKTIFAIALPVILQNIVEYVFQATDLAFISTFDPVDGLSAVNNVFQAFFMFLSFFFAITQGVTIVISQRIGAKHHYTARRFAEVAIFYNLLISLAYLLFWETCGGLVLQLIGAKGNILEIGTNFVRVFSIQFLTFGIGMTAGAIFQAIGKTLPLMIVAIGQSLFNVFFSWLLIFGNWGLPALGIMGSATANVICGVAGNIVLFALLLRTKEIKIRPRMILKPVKKLFGIIMRLGLPVGLEYTLFQFGQVLLIWLANQTDQTSSGYFGAFNVLVNLSTTIYNGIGIASMVMVGNATGAKNPKGALRAANYAIFFSQGICLLIMLLFVFVPDAVLSIFIHDKATRAFMIPYLMLFGTAMFTKALNIIAGNSIRGTGNTLWMMYTQIGGTILIVIVAAFCIFVLKLGFVSLLIAVLCDEGLRCIVNATKFYTAQNKAIRLAEGELAEKMER